MIRSSLTAERFASARALLKMKRGDFAAELGLGRETARAYELGAKPIPRTVAHALANVLNDRPPHR